MKKVIKLNVELELNWKKTRDRRLLEQLMPHYYTVMEGFIRSRYGSQLCDDDIYEIISIALERFVKYEDAICTRFSKVKVTTWLISVVRTIIIDYFHAKKRTYDIIRPIGDLNDIQDNFSNSSKYIDQDEISKLDNENDLESFYITFLNEIDTLPEYEKLFFKLKHIDKLSYNEMMAKYPEFTQSEIRNYIYKAKQTLLKKLKKSYGEIINLMND